MKRTNLSRRQFLQNTALASAAFSILPGSLMACTGKNDVINLGVIGTGKLARGYFDNFAGLEGVHVLAGCDVDALKLADFNQRVDQYYAEKTENPNYSDCRTYEHYQDLLDDRDIDAVLVVTPDHWHAIPAIDAIAAGRDVYCEKPLTHTIHEGRSLVEAARRHKKIVQTGNMQRSWRDFRHACELVLNGYLGEIHQVIVSVGDASVPCNLPVQPTPDHIDWDRWIGPAPMRGYHTDLAPPIENTMWPDWRAYREFGGGGVTDWGAHMFDIAQWALGMDDSGPVFFSPPSDPSKLKGIKMTYANGIEMLHQDFGRGNAVRFIGSEGRLDVSRKFLDSEPANIATAEIKETDDRLYHSDNHYLDWINGIRNRTRTVSDVEIGHRTATVCNIANLAYMLRRDLEWDPAKEEFIGDEEANRLKTKDYREPYTL